MSDHVMVDLETADNVATSAIVSIGALVFRGPSDGVCFYCAVDLTSSKALGLTESQDTMAWWARQAPEAQAVFTDPDRKPILVALAEFYGFVQDLQDPKIWGNGADFDNAILQTAYRLAGLHAPWTFWNNRCYRTAMAGVRTPKDRTGTYHNALDDAKTQADRLLQYRPGFIQ